MKSQDFEIANNTFEISLVDHERALKNRDSSMDRNIQQYLILGIFDLNFQLAQLKEIQAWIAPIICLMMRKL